MVKHGGIVMKMVDNGLFAMLIGVVSIFLQILKDFIEMYKKKSNKLVLKLCEDIEYYDGIYRMKIINKSKNANATNLKVSYRIVNRRFGYNYKFPDFNNQHTIYNSRDNDTASREIYINVDVNKLKTDILSNKKKEMKIEKLELKHFLSERDSYLAVRYNAVNSNTGTVIEFPECKLLDTSIVYGRYGVGEERVKPVDN